MSVRYTASSIREGLLLNGLLRTLQRYWSLGNFSRFDVCTYVPMHGLPAPANHVSLFKMTRMSDSAVSAWALGPLRSSAQNTKKGGRLGEVVAYEKEVKYHGHVVP